MATITVLDSAGATQTVAKVTGTGATTGTNALPVVLATDDAMLGIVTETAPASDTASSGLNGRLQRIAQRVTSLIAQIPASLGIKTAAASMSVTMASDDALLAKFPATLGAKAAASSLAITQSTEDAAQLGSLTETAPASDTASSGVNGRLQRIAQNLSTINTTLGTTNSQLPTALGTNTRAASLGTVLATSGWSCRLGLTRTADTNAYAAGDIIGSATGSTAGLTFTSMGPGAGPILLTSVELEIDASAVISGETSYRLYLYSITPPSALGDNAAFDLPSGDRASFLGYVDLGTPVDLGSTLYVQSLAVNKQLTLAGTSLFGYLVTIGAYTPTSARVHAITLNAVSL